VPCGLKQDQFQEIIRKKINIQTNRSPYPTIHLLHQSQMTLALSHVVDPEKIYMNNIKTLNKLGRQRVELLCPWGK